MSSSLIKLLIVVVTLCLLQVTASAQDCMGPTFQNMACVGRIRNTYNNVNMATVSPSTQSTGPRLTLVTPCLPD